MSTIINKNFTVFKYNFKEGRKVDYYNILAADEREALQIIYDDKYIFDSNTKRIRSKIKSRKHAFCIYTPEECYAVHKHSRQDIKTALKDYYARMQAYLDGQRKSSPDWIEYIGTVVGECVASTFGGEYQLIPANDRSSLKINITRFNRLLGNEMNYSFCIVPNDLTKADFKVTYEDAESHEIYSRKLPKESFEYFKMLME